MSEDWIAALDSLGELDGDIDRDQMVALSGLAKGEAREFIARFALYEGERRRQLVRAFVAFAEQEIELDYAYILRALLEDDDTQIRVMAADGLWEDERPDLVKRFMRLLSCDPADKVRAAAAVALGRFLFLAECDQLSEERGRQIRMLLEETLIAGDTPLLVARRTLESLAYVNDAPIRAHIDRAYTHTNSAMRQSAIFAMGRSAESVWADTVLAELHGDTASMRFEAVRACGELELEAAIPTLGRFLSDRDTELRDMAIWSLGQIGGEAARSLLEAQLVEADEALADLVHAAIDELEIFAPKLDMFVHDSESQELVEHDPAQEGYRDEFYRYSIDEDEWSDEFLDLE